MNKQTCIDTREFADKSLEIHGTIAPLDLERLSDVLGSRDGEIEFALRGSINALGKPQLDLQVKGELQLVCQRCLQPMPYALDATARLVVVPSEDLIPEENDESDDVDYLVADTHQSVMALVEEEVLLSLPLAPVHESDDCSAPIKREQEQKESPFKILQGLKSNKD